ncbi:MAG: hypothetical protein PHV16_04805 [Candidatus Nanoarchaeia archaeon]|nr:hypothetical protein [Candidatus Nanoarchaeia archaeon]
MVLVKKTKKLIFFVMLILLPSFVISISSFDLSDYPKPFVFDSVSLNTLIIVGENAKAEDMIGAVEIANSLGLNISSELIVLDTQIKSVKENNAIVVGGPCVNMAAAELMGFPVNCDDGFYPGKAKIKLFQGLSGQKNNTALLVAGYSAMDTKLACGVLSRYKEYKLEGKDIETSGSILNDIILI